MLRFFSRFPGNSRLWAAALVLAVVFVAIPNTTFAQLSLFKIDDIGQKAVSFLAFSVSWILSLIAGVIISIQSWFLQVILQINFNLVNSAPVRAGFPIVLSISNLFFVAALIVIAIATITRRAEYGAKKVLWKLVVMAVLVNFGLVITGSLLSISDETTKFFIESVTPGSIAEGGTGDFVGFASAIAGAFNPTGAMGITVDEVTRNPNQAKEDLKFINTDLSGNDFGMTIKPIVGVFFTLGTFVVIIITLATLNLMLLWRYIRLGMALILLPVAWAAWIFPAYQEHYKKWWTKFTQWAIFPPVVVFFIWLGLKISEVMSQRSGEFAALHESASNNAISEFLGDMIMPIIESSLQAFILFGIMMGGIIAAQELGIKFADSGYKAVQGTADWAKAKAGRVAGARVRNIGKKYDKEGKPSTSIQRLGSWMQGVRGLKHVPGWQAAGQYVAQQGNTNKRYDENIEKERKGLEGLTNEGLLNAARVASMDPSVNAAKAQELAKRGLLNEEAIGGGDAAKGEEILKRLVQTAERMGNEQSLYNVRPELVRYSKKVADSVKTIPEAIAEAVKKIPVGEANKISHQSLGSQNPFTEVGREIASTFLNLSNSQLAKLGSEGSYEQQQAVLNTFEQMKNTKKIAGNDMTDDQVDQLDRIEKHLNDNANWARSSKP